MGDKITNEIISVIVPSYNYSDYIIECLESVYYQTYAYIELIVIDDYSTDNSVDLIETYIHSERVMHRYLNIQWLKHNQNKGAHFTINEGINLANGKYIAIINADDLFHKERFTRMLKQMKQSDSQISFSRVEIIDHHSLKASTLEADSFRKIQDTIKERTSIIEALIVQNIAISTGNLIFTKQLYKKLKGFNHYKYIHDWDFVLRASLITNPLFVDEEYYYYRLHETNSFRNLEKIANYEVDRVLQNYFNCVQQNEYTNEYLNKEEILNFVSKCFLKKYLKRSWFYNFKLFRK